MKKHIPNTITCCNLICGCSATYFAFQDQYETSFLFIVLGAIFDFFDGFSARLLKVSSPVGKELDSLADVVTFGFAPSAMVFALLKSYAGNASIFPFVAFIMTAFSALRLAKFNLDERQSMGFIGLPTPANALFWSSVALSVSANFPLSGTIFASLLIGIFISSCLLVSEIPMFALKFKHFTWKGNEIRYTFILISFVLLLAFRLHAFMIIIPAYIAVSILQKLLTSKK